MVPNGTDLLPLFSADSDPFPSTFDEGSEGAGADEVHRSLTREALVSIPRWRSHRRSRKRKAVSRVQDAKAARPSWHGHQADLASTAATSRWSLLVGNNRSKGGHPRVRLHGKPGTSQ